MIDKYKQAFQEEARELLGELESALLELDQNRDDREVVGRAFRALHTIKGSGAMFGFDDIAGFAHNLETAFDQLRKGQLAATADLINLTLAAGDQIKTMLDEAAGRGAVDQDRSANILAELRQLTGLTESSPGAALVPGAAQAVATGSLVRDWRIRFRPGPDVLLNGTNPLLLLRELRELGRSGSTSTRPRFRRSRDRSGALLPRLGHGSDHARRRPRRSATSSSSSRTIASSPSSPCRASRWKQLWRRYFRPGRASRTGAPRPLREPRRAFGCRPTSWINWSTWWANW